MIQITPGALAQIRRMMAEQGRDGAALRVGVKESGCSGLEYFLDFTGAPATGDRVSEIDGLKVVVDEKSLPYLEECTLDWGNGLLGSGFRFQNPAAAKTCGCGKSFNL